MTHDPIQQYLSRHSEEIEVGGAGVVAVAAKARRRRHRRTAGLAAAMVGVLLAGGIAVARVDGDRGESIRANGAAIIPSSLTWTTVDATDGLGGLFESSDAVSGSGTYRVSTGPAAQDGSSTGTRLYRTEDGVEWASVALPDGIQPAGVVADSERVYAVGTAPAGGGVATRLLSSADGTDWSGVDLPLPLVDIPGKVVVSSPSVARLGTTTVVAVRASGMLDPTIIPGVAEDTPWNADADGVEVYASCKDPGEDGTIEQNDGPTGEAATTVAPSGAAERAADEPTTTTQSGSASGSGDPCFRETVVARYSWADLGMTAEQGRLVAGELVVFAAQDGQAPSVVARLDSGFYSPLLAAGDSGFWFVGSSRDDSTGQPRVFAIRSTDGLDWTAAPTDLGHQDVFTVGTMGSTPAVALRDSAGAQTLVALDATGPRTIELTSVLGESVAGRIGTVEFGPLGVAIAYGDTADGRPGLVAHSTDGTTFSLVELPAAPAGTDEHVSGVSVSADAITVRLNRYPAGIVPDERTRPEQRAFVGTPG